MESQGVQESTMSSASAGKIQQQKQPPPTAGNQSYITCNDDTSTAKRPGNTWSTVEDVLLTRLVKGAPDIARVAWNLVAAQIDNRTGKQCRERYHNSLKPDRKKGQWTELEDSQINNLQELWGNQWSRIAAELPGRTDNDIKNRWHSMHRTKEKKRKGTDVMDGDKPMKTDSSTTKPTRKRSKKDHAMEPKVGQRVQVKFDGGKVYGATITKVSKQSVASLIPSYNLMICYDDGVSEETVFPDSDIQLLPSKKNLNGNDLSSLSSTLNTPHEADRVARHQPTEEEYHDDYLFEHIATLKRSRDSDHETRAATTYVDLDNAAAHQDWNWNTASTKDPQTKKDKDSNSSLKTDSSVLSSSDSSVDSQSEAGGEGLLEGIRKPGNNDCIFGRGGGTNYHPGNLKYRKLAEEIKPAYKAATRLQKATMSMQMVKDWRTQQDPPGRFLKLNEETGLWDDVGDHVARIKCAQGLRERKSSKLVIDPNIYLSRASP